MSARAADDPGLFERALRHVSVLVQRPVWSVCARLSVTLNWTLLSCFRASIWCLNPPPAYTQAELRRLRTRLLSQGGRRRAVGDAPVRDKLTPGRRNSSSPPRQGRAAQGRRARADAVTRIGSGGRGGPTEAERARAGDHLPVDSDERADQVVWCCKRVLICVLMHACV